MEFNREFSLFTQACLNFLFFNARYTVHRSTFSKLNVGAEYDNEKEETLFSTIYCIIYI